MPLIETTGSASAKALGFNKVSGSATYIEDVFSTYLYDGGSGYGIIVNNGISLQGPQNTGGSVKFTSASNQRLTLSSQVTFFTGTIEAWIYPTTTDDMIVFSSTTDSNAQYFRINESGNIGAVSCYINGASISPTGTYIQVNKWNHIAACFTGSTVRLLVNGVLAGSTSFSSTVYFGVIGAFYLSGNFYGNPFNGYISNVRAIDGTALYSGAYNIPSAPLSLYSGSATKLLALQGSTPFTNNASSGITLNNINTAVADTNGPTITNDGTGGLVWIKNRSTTSNQVWADTTRQPYYLLYSNSTNAQTYDASAVTNFLPNGGFGLGAGTDTNNSSYKYTSWTFKKQPKFFDVVTYTGTGVARTITHNLGSVPGCIIVKRTDTTGDWQVYHRGMPTNGFRILLNSTAAYSFGNYWNYTDPTATEFSVGTNGDINVNGGTYVAYLFAHNAGGFGLSGADNVISCGSFTTDGSGIATVTLGYEPQFILYKMSSSSQDWFIQDTMRGMPNPSTNAPVLNPNLSSAEYTDSKLYPTATGFYSGNACLSGNQTYIYIAIRRGPMKTPTSGTSVFAPDIGSSSGTSTFDSGFVVDFAMDKSRTVSPSSARAFDRLRGAYETLIPSTNAEASSTVLWDSNTALRFNSTANISTRIGWLFQRASGFMDVVCYTGTGSARTVTHNLGVAPELMIVKRRDTTGSWRSYSQTLGSGYMVSFNNSDAPVYGGTDPWNDTAPTSSVFSVSGYADVNANGGTYVAYLFASCPGVSKVGSYSGTGGTQTISCGFAARFVMIRRIDSTGDWWVWDTARGMIAGTDPRLALNSTAADTNNNWVYTDASGFQIVTTDASVNASGGSYIFLAVA